MACKNRYEEEVSGIIKVQKSYQNWYQKSQKTGMYSGPIAIVLVIAGIALVVWGVVSWWNGNDPNTTIVTGSAFVVIGIFVRQVNSIARRFRDK